MNKYSIERGKPFNNFKHVLKIMRTTLFLLFFCILFFRKLPIAIHRKHHSLWI